MKKMQIYTKAFHLAMADLLYQPEKRITNDEWDVLVRIYQERYKETGDFVISGSLEQRERFYYLIQELPRFKEIELSYTR